MSGSPADTGAPLDVDGGTLRRRSVRGGLSVVLARGSADVIRVAAMLILARLLTPADFGVVAMVTAVVGIADVIQDLGLSSAAVQRATLTHEQSSTLFWLNVGLGTIGTLAVVASADLVADLVDDARVRDVALLLAPVFMLSSLSTQPKALLRRALRFTDIAKIQVSAALVYGGVSIGLAVAGTGRTSLAWGLLASQLVIAVVTLSLARFRPGRPRFDRSTREMASFGASLAGFVVLQYLAVNVQAVLIGRADGAAATGLYGRADRLQSIATGYLMGPVTSVAFPVMSRLNDDPERWSRYFLKAQMVVVITTFGIAPLLVVHADVIVEVLLGSEWSAAAPVLAIQGVAVAAIGLCNPTGWIYQSRGDAKRMLRWGAFGWTVMLGSTVAGVPYGIEGVAWGYTIGNVVLVWPALWYAYRGTPLSVARVLRSVLPVALCASAAAAVSYGAAELLSSAPAVPRVLLCAGVHLALYAGLLATVGGQRELLGSLREQFGGRRPGGILAG